MSQITFIEKHKIAQNQGCSWRPRARGYHNRVRCELQVFYFQPKPISLLLSSSVHSSAAPLWPFLSDRALGTMRFFITNCCLLHRLQMVAMKRRCCNWDTGHGPCNLVPCMFCATWVSAKWPLGSSHSAVTAHPFCSFLLLILSVSPSASPEFTDI